MAFPIEDRNSFNDLLFGHLKYDCRLKIPLLKNIILDAYIIIGKK